MKVRIPFYDTYFSFPAFQDNGQAQKYKDAYIREKAFSGYIYKFVAFSENEELNRSKIGMIREKKLWVSNYKNFSDINEVSISCDLFKISHDTGIPVKNVNLLINLGKQMNDVSCFTYMVTPFMWTHYANNSNGICLQFKLMDTDKFFPVIYLNKAKVDYTEDFISAYISQDYKYISRVSILPWVLKDEDYSLEDELRFLCGDIYDNEDDIMGGRIAPGKKELMGYKGTSYSYDYSGIVLSDILFGCNCRDDCKKAVQNLI